MSAESNLKIGVIGAGTNTKLKHIPGFQAIESVSVDVICNRSEESSRKAAEEFNVPRIASHWEEVIADPEIDAICIGTWPYLHAPITIAALQAGKHVLTEARMAMDASQAREMLEASASKPDFVAQIVPSPFTLFWDQTIKDMLQEGALGELREAVFNKTLPGNANSSTPLSWRQNIEYSGNNTIMLGIYYEVVQRWLRRDPKRVLASGNIFTASRMDPEKGREVEVKIPDTIHCLAEYDDGLRFLGYMSGVTHGVNWDGYLINGSEGTLRLDLVERKLFYTRFGSAEEEVEVAAEKQADWRVEADFVESIRSGKPVTLTSFEDGLAYMKFTDAAIESYRSGGVWVDLG